MSSSGSGDAPASFGVKARMAGLPCQLARRRGLRSLPEMGGGSPGGRSLPEMGGGSPGAQSPRNGWGISGPGAKRPAESDGLNDP